jgi:transcriptional regulator with XRE-family HTH domain
MEVDPGPGEVALLDKEDLHAVMARLTRRRAELGLSRIVVAALMESTEHLVSELEAQAEGTWSTKRTRDRVPRFDTLRRWAHAVGMEVELTLRELPEDQRRLVHSRLTTPVRRQAVAESPGG